MTQLENYILENESRFIEDLKAWLRIPSISTLPEHVKDIQQAASFAADQLKQIGLEKTGLIETAGNPLVYGEWLKAPGKRTILLYGHYDVQPVDPVSLWDSPPFEPTIKGDNLYARGASDDKGQTMLVLKALESLMRVNGALPLNVRVLLEGEEEAGGEAIDAYVRSHADELKCDASFICDTGMPGKDMPALVYGLRGIVYTEVEVNGAKRDLHSGSYGGVAPNPLHALALIIADLKDRDGHIQIPGLYDSAREPSEAERTFWKEDPIKANTGLLEEMEISELSGESEYPPLERIWARPTLEVHGIVGGFVGEGAKTVIPATATAKISLRIPPDLHLSSTEVFKLFEKRVYEVAPRGVEVKVRNVHGGEAVEVPLNSPFMEAATDALREVFGKEPVMIREGGSIPIAALFDEKLHAPTVLMGFALPEDDVHAPNEKYSLTQFKLGLRSVARFLEKLG
jgi:acetylornithine deacetylase/succinyl-diaminopimelate desuccinylase-like protein